MGYIYKITNTKTGKMYVGQTTYSIERRWREHRSKAKQGERHYLLYQAIRKCGEKFFNIEIIEECPNDKLNEKEVFWIKTLGTYGNGYNMNEGGKTNLYAPPSQEEINDWWYRFTHGESVSAIAKTTKFHRETIMKKLSEFNGYKKIAKQYMTKNNKDFRCMSFFDLIYEYDKNGNYIQTIYLPTYKLRIRDKNRILDVVLGKRKTFRKHYFTKNKIAQIMPN